DRAELATTGGDAPSRSHAATRRDHRCGERRAAVGAILPLSGAVPVGVRNLVHRRRHADPRLFVRRDRRGDRRAARLSVAEDRAMKTLPLVVEHLSFTFAGRAAPTLRDISYSIEPGSWTVLAGRSGSGKSTLLRAMAGLIPHHSAGQMQGDVLLFGRNTRSTTPAELASQAGLLLQLPDDQICTTTVGAEIAFGLENLALPSEEIASRVRES